MTRPADLAGLRAHLQGTLGADRRAGFIQIEQTHMQRRPQRCTRFLSGHLHREAIHRRYADERLTTVKLQAELSVL